jgi:hypothetical protein
MVERNEKGKQAHLYFIECERRVKSKVLFDHAPKILRDSVRITASAGFREYSSYRFPKREAVIMYRLSQLMHNIHLYLCFHKRGWM